MESKRGRHDDRRAAGPGPTALTALLSGDLPYFGRCPGVRVTFTSRPHIVPLIVKVLVAGSYVSVTSIAQVRVLSPMVVVVEPFRVLLKVRIFRGWPAVAGNS